MIEKNLIRELGIYNKQAAAVLQALAASTTIRDNVFFNMPRAGIDLIDGFGGNHTIERNFGSNCVRETSDNGPVNTWDVSVAAQYVLVMLLQRCIFIYLFGNADSCCV